MLNSSFLYHRTIMRVAFSLCSPLSQASSVLKTLLGKKLFCGKKQGKDIFVRSSFFSNGRTQLSSGSNFFTTNNTIGCWSLVRKTRPKYLPTVPVGKVNNEGKMITDQEGLKELYLDTFLWRLRDRPIRPDLKDLQSVKTKMFEAILKTCA